MRAIFKRSKTRSRGPKIGGYLAPSVTFSLAVTSRIYTRCGPNIVFKEIEKNTVQQNVIAVVHSPSGFLNRAPQNVNKYYF